MPVVLKVAPFLQRNKRLNGYATTRLGFECKSLGTVLDQHGQPEDGPFRRDYELQNIELLHQARRLITLHAGELNNVNPEISENIFVML